MFSTAVEELYNRITGEEDARVCRDIPEAACDDQPRNFFAYLWANLLGKIADEIASAKLIIPWLLGALGAPAAFTGYLVPIREGGVLLPQLAVAAVVRRLPKRKGVWIAGALLSMISLFGMAWVALSMQGAAAGIGIIAMLVIYSLARGLCSVSAKDVLGKTVSKSRRGALMGWSASLSGLLVLALGLSLGAADLQQNDSTLFAGLFLTAATAWLIAAAIFALIREQPGATEGGGNALTVAVAHVRLLHTDSALRRFIVARTLLLSVALAPPFYVLVAQQDTDAGLLGLGALIVANGLASSLSAPFWGYMGDQASRKVMALAATGAGLLGVLTWFAHIMEWSWALSEVGMGIIFLLLNIMHSGVRLGRKIYLVDMASADNRAAYVALSNTVIGVMMLIGGLIGVVGDWLGAAAILLLLGTVSLLAAAYIMRLPDVSHTE